MTVRTLWSRLTYPLRRRRVERELQAEIELHLALRSEQLERAGLSTKDAALASARRFGNRPRILDAARAAWGWSWIDGTGQDVRYVARQLRRAPVFALVTSLTVAIGIALNATAFTFYDAFILKPLPVAEPDHVVRIVEEGNAFGSELLPFAAYDVLRRAQSIDSVVAVTPPLSIGAVLPGHVSTDARVLSARFVSPEFARMLGIGTTFGRWFDAGDDRAVVLDHDFWTRALSADPNILGKRIRAGDVDLTIVGVAPTHFAGTGMPAIAPELWLPMSSQPAVAPNGNWQHDNLRHWQLLARLPARNSLARVNAELASLQQSVPDSAGKPIPLVAKRATFFQTDAGEFEVFRQVSAALTVALALILGIAAANLLNLFAARNAAREREVTVRLALGASRARIARQLAIESLFLAMLGGAIGVAMSRVAAAWARDWLVTKMTTVSGGIANVFLDITMDWRIVVYAAALSLVIGLVVGLWPAMRASRSDVNGVLRQGSSSAAAHVWGRRNVLLAAQVASSLVLLTAAGMLVSGLRLARAIDPRFDAAHLLVVDVEDDSPMPERALHRAAIAQRLATVPGVRAVTWTRRVPFAGTHLRRADTPSGPITIAVDDASESYFDVMGMPILHGRGFTRDEVASNAPVMVISESMQRRRWPAGDALGRSVAPNDPLGGPDTSRYYTVIGVTRDVRSQFLSRSNGPSVYYPYGFDRGNGAFLVRTAGAPSAAVNAVRLAIANVSATLSTGTHIVTMMDGPMALQRLMAELPALLAFGLALVGLLLSSVGVYGLISNIVARRTREIGVHLAIGARPLDVIWLVTMRTLRPVVWGALIGGAGAVALSLFLHSLIVTPDIPDLTFGGGAFSPAVFGGVFLVLISVVAAACVLPARRAARLDPTVALRAE